ncbi:MAG: hypothetical protein IKH57_18490 [Clostridia bacterium]|nr:hypothetical protein [Clostridia bacterium]
MTDIEKARAQLERLKKLNEEIEKERVTPKYHYGKKMTKYFSSAEEDEFYYAIGLKEQIVDKRSCLVQPMVTLGTKDSRGITNDERMRRGLPPIFDNISAPMQLHHVKQSYYGPFAELTSKQHLDNYQLLHPFSREYESWRNNQRQTDEFQRQKIRHWRERRKLIYAGKIPR